MNKKVIIPLVVVILALLGGLAWLYFSLQEQKQVTQDMQELAALDKQEMENEYERFALQYSEMKTQINNDSIIAQLTQEQMKTQQLLQELKQVKASDAREIARLKKELATVRAVLRDYVMQIDSLNRLNENLKAENTRVNAELEQRNGSDAPPQHTVAHELEGHLGVLEGVHQGAQPPDALQSACGNASFALALLGHICRTVLHGVCL